MARTKHVSRPLPAPSADGMTREQLVELARAMERKEQHTARAWREFEVSGETSETDEYPDSGSGSGSDGDSDVQPPPPQVPPAMRTPAKKQKQPLLPLPAGKVAKRAQRRGNRRSRMDETQRRLFDTHARLGVFPS